MYGDMLFKDLPGAIARGGYCIHDFYLEVHGLRCQKNTIIIIKKLLEYAAVFLQKP